MAQSSSIVSTVSAPALVGVWLHAPDNPIDTSTNYIYGNTSRTESIGIQGKPLQFIGRTYPVYDTGGFESQTLKIDIIVPYGPDEQDEVEWFRTSVRNRKTICYRDSRGRKHYVIIVAVDFADTKVGTSVSFTATTIDYTEDIS